ncbi:hypothetical protein [Novosphingobium aquimarinum]|uniref:hypothetical protein n=1 Tax=Novosphingobium aquimarinum TaxID=2682494 RepID=UPI0012ECA4C4|nr:hypothetical protein [Novosphingobium aquimarinum]
MARPFEIRRHARIPLSLVLLGLLAWGVAVEPVAVAQIFSRPGTSTSEPKPPRRETTPNRKKQETVRRRRPAKSEAPPPQPERASFADPIEYCAYYQDVDAPDNAYTGDRNPSWVRQAASGASAGAADTLFWRCASGRVIACLGPEDAQQDGGRCARATQPDDADIRGFIAANWIDVTSYDARFTKGDVAGQYLGARKGLASGEAYDEDDYLVQMTITGGAVNDIVGEATYARPGPDGAAAQTVCTSQLRLVAVSDSAISLNQESPKSAKTPCRASRQLVLQPVGATARLQSFEVRRGKRNLKMETWLY